MEGEFLPSSKGGGHRQHQKSPGSPIQLGTRPDRSPGVSRNQVLKLVCEISRRSDGVIDVCVAKHSSTQFESGLQVVDGGMRWQKKLEQRCSKRSRPFNVGKMCRREVKSLCARNSGYQPFTVSAPWSGDVMVAYNHKGWRFNLPQQVSVIHVAEGCTATCVSHGIGTQK